jgi:hypothetical protein
MNDINWCEFFQKIEKDPSAITPRITIRQILQARNHVYDCDVCFNRTERILAKAPKESLPKHGEN